GESEGKAIELIEAHAKYITTGLPLVIAKFASSLDGKIATRSGDSSWITGERARDHAHRVRAQVDAIMVGVNTVLADDPQLTARPGGRLAQRQPLRVIVDSRGRTPPTAKVLKGPGKVLIATTGDVEGGTAQALRDMGVEVVVFPSAEGGVDLKEMFRYLGRREITSVLVEGGGALLGSIFDMGLADKVMAYIAPVVIGGQKAVPAVAGLGVERMAEAPRLDRVKVRRLGQDVLVEGYVNPAGKIQRID
ncbi:MAG: riboflavin biosynthesis protein RibD, partial [Dehalococcoidia bacterium]|nr:riboflavin biosynthesis protein RibD [Dehalococcoidia bacterium]